MFKRDLAPTLKKVASQFPVIVLTGPRQSGKTTLLRQLFTKHNYINLENPETLMKVQSDPKGFFHEIKSVNWIIDEAQKFPQIFSYLQQWVDEYNIPGKFILSGSKNFLLLHSINQTLAGRAVILELLPLNYKEYITYPCYKDLDLYDYLYHGSYPRIYHENLDLELWYNSYISTYLERDIRDIINIKDLSKFQIFLKLCAGRHGQLLNLNAIAQECGISQPTATNWLSILEASYIIFKLQPYYRNFNKRLVKMPKLYFYDSAIVCQLLNIDSKTHLSMHASLGAIFEGFILAEIKKILLAKGKKTQLYFWRSHTGDEIDGILEYGNKLLALEIKSTMTFNSSLLKNLIKWLKISENAINTQGFLIYGGNDDFINNKIQIISWKTLYSVLGLTQN